MENDNAEVNFKIDCLDHVAIRVADLERSMEWYKKILGLKVYQLEAWGEFPVFLLSGTTGIALFPADPSEKSPPMNSKHIKIDHFAFRLSRSEFEKARTHYEEIGLDYEFQDHTYFHSIYTRDPDGHVVELTTLTVEPAEFFQWL